MGKWNDGRLEVQAVFFLFSMNNSFSIKKTRKRAQQLPYLLPNFTCVHNFSLRSDQ